MIQSLKRLVRQMWVGARPARSSEALMMTPEDVATFSAQAKIRRENLKRAMEVAFAPPPPPVAIDEPVLVLDASIAVAKAAAVAEERARESSNEVGEVPVVAACVVEDVPVTHSLVEEIRSGDVAALTHEAPAFDEVAFVVEPQEAVVEATGEDAAEVPADDQPICEDMALAECATVNEDASDVLTALMPSEAAVAVDVAEVVEPVSEMAEAEVAAAEAEVVAEVPAVAELAEELPVAEDVSTAESEAVLVEADVMLVAEPAEVEPLVMEQAVDAGAAFEDAALEDVAPKGSRAKKAAPKKKPAAAPKKKAASKKKVQALEDDVWVSDAVAYSLTGAWSEEWVPPVDEAGASRLEEFRAKAAEGVITIWGRTADGEDQWEPIKATYWKSGTFEPMSFVEGRENVATEAKKGKGKAPAVYSALKVSRAQVEELWGTQSAH